MKQLKLDQKTGRILSQGEVQKILSAIKEKWFHHIIAFNVLTGLRLGEIMNLKWSDYDATKREITIQTSKEYRIKGARCALSPVAMMLRHFWMGVQKEPTESLWATG